MPNEVLKELLNRTNSFYEICVLILGILAIIPRIRRAIFSLAINMWLLLKFLYILPTKIEPLLRLLDEKVIEKLISSANQLQPNGGESLFDSINQIKLQLMLGEDARRASLTAFGMAFWETDPKGNVLFASKKVAEYMGMETSELLGNGWLTAVHSDDRVRVNDEWEQAVEQHRIFISTFKVVHRSGKVFTIQCQAFPVFDSPADPKIARHVLRFIGALTLISEEPPKKRVTTDI